MTISLAPPPLQIPSDFARDKEKSAFFSALLNTLYQLWTSTYSIRAFATVKTTDDTDTGLVRISVPTNKTVMIDACIVARRTGGTAGTAGDSAFYRLTGAYKNISGTLTGIGTPLLNGGEDNAAWTAGFSSSGEFAVITVTGDVGNNITWESAHSVYTVGA